MKKPKKAKNPPLPKDNLTAPAPPTSEEIAICAYAIWEQQGRPSGREAEHWQAAEAQIRQGRGLRAPPE